MNSRMNGYAPGEGEFSVVQFFPDESYEFVRRFVSGEEAVKAVQHYTTSVGARLGFVTKVIITDGGDFTCYEWVYGKGQTFPPPKEGGDQAVDKGEPENDDEG